MGGSISVLRTKQTICVDFRLITEKFLDRLFDFHDIISVVRTISTIYVDFRSWGPGFYFENSDFEDGF